MYLKEELYKACFSIHDAVAEVLLERGAGIEVPSSAEVQSATSILKNIKLPKFPVDKRVEAVAKIIESAPYLEGFWEYLLESSDKEEYKAILEYANQLGVSLQEYVQECLLNQSSEKIVEIIIEHYGTPYDFEKWFSGLSPIEKGAAGEKMYGYLLPKLEELKESASAYGITSIFENPDAFAPVIEQLDNAAMLAVQGKVLEYADELEAGLNNDNLTESYTHAKKSLITLYDTPKTILVHP